MLHCPRMAWASGAGVPRCAIRLVTPKMATLDSALQHLKQAEDLTCGHHDRWQSRVNTRMRH